MGRSHAAAGLPDAAAKATPAASRPIAARPLAADAVREAANLQGHRGVLSPKADTGSPVSVGTACEILSVRFRANRQTHRKDRTFAWLARHRHVATHPARELAGNARPRLVPPNFRAVSESAWVNSARSLANCSGAIPMRYPRPQARSSCRRLRPYAP